MRQLGHKEQKSKLLNEKTLGTGKALYHHCPQRKGQQKDSKFLFHLENFSLNETSCWGASPRTARKSLFANGSSALFQTRSTAVSRVNQQNHQHPPLWEKILMLPKQDGYRPMKEKCYWMTKPKARGLRLLRLFL